LETELLFIENKFGREHTRLKFSLENYIKIFFCLFVDRNVTHRQPRIKLVSFSKDLLNVTRYDTKAIGMQIDINAKPASAQATSFIAVSSEVLILIARMSHNSHFLFLIKLKQLSRELQEP
jgi:hypothetical protein